MSRLLHTLSLIAVALLLGACASSTRMAGIERPPAPEGDKCLALFEQVDRRIREMGVADAGYARIEGFPYLRSDRFSASFANQMADVEDMDTFWEWVGYLRANEDEARDVELRNLGLDPTTAASLLTDLRGCGAWLRSWELEVPEFRAHLLKLVQPPDEYSEVARTLGVWPLTRGLFRRSVHKRRNAVLADYATPLAKMAPQGQMIRWEARRSAEFPHETVDLRDRPRDHLGRIGMLWSEVLQMAQFHAPQLWIDTVESYDLPGTPQVGGKQPGVDVKAPVLYFLPGYTRFGGRNLLQISYFVWFDRNGADQALDGLIWRVTFDERGQPLLYDSIRACGCDHFAFPVRKMTRRDVAEDAKTMLFPQDTVPTGPVAVRIASGAHGVQRVVATEDVQALVTRQYQLKPYDELLTLPLPEGGTRSLFGPDGLVDGTERGERFWLWPTGVRGAGSIRQWSHHATTLVGKTHFDDPFLFEQVLVPPDFEGGGPTVAHEDARPATTGTP